MANDPLEGFHEVNLASPTSPDLLGVCDPGTQEQTTSPSVIYRPHPSSLCSAPLQANALDLSDLPTQPVYSSPRRLNCAEIPNVRYEITSLQIPHIRYPMSGVRSPACRYLISDIQCRV